MEENENIISKKYTFLISVYIKSNPEQIKESFGSMINQTLKPDQIVVVCDGPVTEEVDKLITAFAEENPNLFTIEKLEKNCGHGLALRAGTELCRNEYIAVMDDDDICVLTRCEKEVEFLNANPDIDVVGANIAEFIGTVNNVVSIRAVPEKHEDIVEYMKSRCPLNHVTAMMKKSSLERAGGYMHWHLNEDSYLWARMYLADCKFHNLQENLVFVRVGESMFARRGGYKYYKSERDLFKFMYKEGIIGFFAYQKAKFIRFAVQVLMPNFVRQWAFIHLMRSKPDGAVQSEKHT